MTKKLFVAGLISLFCMTVTVVNVRAEDSWEVSKGAKAAAVGATASSANNGFKCGPVTIGTPPASSPNSQIGRAGDGTSDAANEAASVVPPSGASCGGDCGLNNTCFPTTTNSCSCQKVVGTCAAGTNGACGGPCAGGTCATDAAGACTCTATCAADTGGVCGGTCPTDKNCVSKTENGTVSCSCTGGCKLVSTTDTDECPTVGASQPRCACGHDTSECATAQSGCLGRLAAKCPTGTTLVSTSTPHDCTSDSAAFGRNNYCKAFCSGICCPNH